MPKSQVTRCVNLDWLECHCLEPQGQPHDADFFRRAGFVVRERPYGTRVYNQMFSLEDENGHPWIEIRRDPASQGVQGIHLAEECHLRLTNYACYWEDAADAMANFIERYDYIFNRISRVDVCLDFEFFDYGDNPQDFISRYLKNKYAKINQANIHAHGTDSWNGQLWHSLSWGSPTSDIGTKMYNKTLELYDRSTASYKKPYILWAWKSAGLIDDPIRCTRLVDGSTITPTIWRIEFSIRSSVKKWFVIELNGKRKAYQSIWNTLDQYNTRPKLLTMFASLTKHYFHFKHVIRHYNFYKTGDTSGQAIRKDRCPDKLLFRWTGQQYCYKPEKGQKLIGDGTSVIRPLNSLIDKIRHYKETHFGADIHRACDILIEAMESENIRRDMTHPWSREELLALQRAISMKADGNQTNVAILLAELKELLRINDLTAIF